MDTAAWQVPTRTHMIWFWLRTRAHVACRVWRDAVSQRVHRWSEGNGLADAPIVAQLHMPLWQGDEASEFVLTAGKVQNLRLASHAFDGMEVPAGEVLSFWRQLGRPSARRGYVPGREVREGCLVPTVGGGLCQISNALATCASRAGFELVERHAHSARPDSRPGRDGGLDATVFWNYVDLRIRAPVAWRVELELTSSKLVLRLRALQPVSGAVKEPASKSVSVSSSAPALRGCWSCGETRCFRHRPPTCESRGRQAWLLDGWTPEAHEWLKSQDSEADRMQPVPVSQLRSWLLRRPLAEIDRGWAGLPQGRNVKCDRFGWVSLKRAWWLRHYAHVPGKRQASIVDGRRWLAGTYMRHLRPEHTHLVVDQGLLPHLQLLGALGGRTYDVLADALSMEEIQFRLDHANSSTAIGERQCESLRDFRADSVLVQAELAAMRDARWIVTPHTEVADYWRGHSNAHVHRIPWALPVISIGQHARRQGSYPLVVFPASALPRKGICELIEAMYGLHCRLRVLGAGWDESVQWKGVAIEQGNYADDWLLEADVVVLPAYVEHSPRALLMAVAAGVPVIATPACGVQGLPGIRLVPPGDADSLRQVLSGVLADDRSATVQRAAKLFGGGVNMPFASVRHPSLS
ncbi:MAG: glycosyltransferase [Rhodanobacter sp.]|nr:MAG: glycosyltransferase [Rhodanobacter sp.]